MTQTSRSKAVTATPKQTLVAHMHGLHGAAASRLNFARATHAALVAAHTQEHHRHRCSHHHGSTSGPGSRPLGWTTGKNVVLRASEHTS